MAYSGLSVCIKVQVKMASGLALCHYSPYVQKYAEFPSSAVVCSAHSIIEKKSRNFIRDETTKEQKSPSLN
jgi:hypothetical protein